MKYEILTKILDVVPNPPIKDLPNEAIIVIVVSCVVGFLIVATILSIVLTHYFKKK